MEVCSSVDGVKYVFMYVYKGSDRQMVTTGQLIEGADDEMTAYRDFRSIGASEACWRLFSSELSDRSPAVVALQVHLEHHQLVFFQHGGTANRAAPGRRPGRRIAASRPLLTPSV